MTLHHALKKIVGPQIFFWLQILFEQKNVFLTHNLVRTQYLFPSKFFFKQLIFFGLKILLDPKFLLEPKKFRNERFFRTRFFSDLTFFVDPKWTSWKMIFGGRKQSFWTWGCLNWQGQRFYFNWSLTLETKSCFVLKIYTKIYNLEFKFHIIMHQLSQNLNPKFALYDRT